MAISLDDIKNLRERTGAGMADCKKALEDADGNMDEAIEILRKKGAATAAKRADKAADEGMIATAVADDHKSAAMVEINCETDFVARNEEFSTFAEQLAEVVLNDNPSTEDELMDGKIGSMSVRDSLNELLAKFSERIEVRRFARIESSTGYVTDYVHGGSRLGVLIELSAPAADEATGERVARDVAMQVAAMNPQYVRREEVETSVLDKEKEIYRDQLAGENKPAEIIDRIVNGRVEKFYEESVLLEQSFVKDSAKSVSEILNEAGSGLTVNRFIRFNLGESVQETAEADNA